MNTKARQRISGAVRQSILPPLNLTPGFKSARPGPHDLNPAS